MATATDRYIIVAAVDFFELTSVVIERALDMAARHGAPQLHFLSVIEPSGWLRREEDQSDDLAELHQALERRVGEALADFGHPERLNSWRLRVHTRIGGAADSIADLAAEAEADLIVVGRHGHAGERRLFAGSVPEKLLKLARCTVMVVQPADYGPQPVEPVEPPCPDCVALRAESDGEQWFCEHHSQDRLSRSAYMVPHSVLTPGGGPMW